MNETPNRGMLDTSTVIMLGRIADPSALPEESVISAITLAELSVGPHVATSDQERAIRQSHLQQAESDFDVAAFDGGAARAFGAVAASLRASGRKPAARAYDALIAATAIVSNRTLVTRNRKHFRMIPDLMLKVPEYGTALP